LYGKVKKKVILGIRAISEFGLCVAKIRNIGVKKKNIFEV